MAKEGIAMHCDDDVDPSYLYFDLFEELKQKDQGGVVGGIPLKFIIPITRYCK